MKLRRALLIAAGLALALALPPRSNAQPPDPPEGRVQARPHDGPQYARRADGDPFELLAQLRGTPTLVPARALAVIPERNTDRPVRLVDTLARIEPQFDDLARGAGLSPQRAIQLRTREANIPIFVAKNETTISTVLQIELGTRIEVQGVLIERGGRYLFLASAVRPAPARRER